MAPPQSHRGESLQEGFEQLIQHNRSTSFPQSQKQSNYSNSFDTDDDALSSAPSSFGSSYHPSPEENGSFYQDQESPFSYGDPNVGLGISYDGQESPTPMKRGTPYGNVVDDDSIYGYGTPDMSPPPSNMSTPDVRRTRSGQIINRPIQNLRPSRASPAFSRSDSPAPRASPEKKVKKEKVKTERTMAKLERPLSVLTAAWTHVPVVDIEAYVNRPDSVRLAEVETGKTPGKVKRPMNSFMLYRKAYQNRTKNWCLQNNHQVVSQVCGDSWPLEPKEVREKFELWAKIERQNHQNAHPGYKFSPSKAGSKAAAKRKAGEPDEESVLSDYDWQGSRASSRPSKRQMLTPKRTPGPAAPNQFNSTPYYTHSAPASRESSMGPGMDGSFGGGYLNSMYQTHNPGRPAPPQYHSALEESHNGSYWQQQVCRNGQVEDVLMRRANATGYSEQTFNDSFYGSPAAPQAFQVKQEVKIDPSLMDANAAYEFADPSMFQESFGLQVGEFSQPGFDRPLQEEYPEYLGQEIGEALHLPLGGQEGWQVESLGKGEVEFDKWAEGP